MLDNTCVITMPVLPSVPLETTWYGVVFQPFNFITRPPGPGLVTITRPVAVFLEVSPCPEISEFGTKLPKESNNAAVPPPAFIVIKYCISQVPLLIELDKISVELVAFVPVTAIVVFANQFEKAGINLLLSN
jgi:hypothetical protein